MVASPKTWSFVYHLTLDKSISGLTALISPMFTRRLYLLLTVGVLTFISREKPGMIFGHPPSMILELQHLCRQGLLAIYCAK